LIVASAVFRYDSFGKTILEKRDKKKEMKTSITGQLNGTPPLSISFYSGL